MNNNLHLAHNNQNDEFYTQIADIERELRYYKEHFNNKVVLCNCDDPEWSNFWKFFHLNFSFLGLKTLITTHYHPTEPTYMMLYEGNCDSDLSCGKIIKLRQNGDFRSDECVELLKQADIVVTNPPFSIAREYYIPLLFQHNKSFLIIGDLNWITYRYVFPLLKDNRMWFGYNSVKQFKQPDGSIKTFGNKLWFTNLDIKKRHEEIDLIKSYNSDAFPKYDNYEAIEVSRVLDIPNDYDGVMGVPITFMTQYNPNQFEIVGMAAGNTRATGFNFSVPYTPHPNDRGGCGVVNGLRKYARLLIKHRR